MISSYEDLSRLEDPAYQPRDVASLLTQVLGSDVYVRARQLKRAAQAWHEANGDQERSHTKAVFLAPPRGSATTPRLVVYVDSNVLLADFRTNADLYLGRLANWGFSISGIDFRLSRRMGNKDHVEQSTDGLTQMQPQQPRKKSMPEDVIQAASDEERRYADKLTSEIPQELREKVRQTLLTFLVKKRDVAGLSS